MSAHDTLPPVPPVVTPPAAYPPATLAGLLELCSRPIALDVVVRDKPLRITGRRLKGAEVEALRELLTAPLAPVGEGGKDHDLADPGYRAKVKAAQAQARAYTLFACYPLFGEQAPAELDRRDPAALADWLAQSGLESALLELLYEAVTTEVVSVPRDRVLFI